MDAKLNLDKCQISSACTNLQIMAQLCFGKGGVILQLWICSLRIHALSLSRISNYSLRP